MDANREAVHVVESVCPKCENGREVCSFCHDIPYADWEAICDCGLYDFGHHLISCHIVIGDGLQ